MYYYSKVRAEDRVYVLLDSALAESLEKTETHVCGGVETDVRARVLDAAGDIIPGLYACGFAGNRDYYGTEQVGSVGLQTCVTTGRLAAEAIAEELGAGRSK